MSDAPLPIGDPVELGFDPDRLAQIGPAMQQFVDSKKVPNLVTLLAKKGQIVHYEARGVLDLEQGNPVGKDSLFRMFSNTKPIAGVATLILFERESSPRTIRSRVSYLNGEIFRSLIGMN